MALQLLHPTASSTIAHLYQAIPFAYMAIFPVLNPLGSAFLILSLTYGSPEAIYQQLCRRIAINTFILMFVVLAVGTYVLRFFGITVPIVQIGGGFVVAMIGWHLLNKTDAIKTEPDDEANLNKSLMSKAFYPYTMPITAGPGCIAVTLTISAHETSSHSIHDTLLGQAGVTIGLILLSLTVYFCYRYAEIITKKLGSTGTQVIMRMSAFINFCIGLQIMWHGTNTLLYNLFA